MITLEFIEQRIKDMQVELSMLRATHDQAVSKFQQTQQQFQEQVDQNQKRFQQLSGAIAELRKLEQTVEQKRTQNEPTNLNSGNSGSFGIIDRVSGAGGGPADNRRIDLGDRNLHNETITPGDA